MLSRVRKANHASPAEQTLVPAASSLLAPPASPRVLVNPFSLPTSLDESRPEPAQEQRASSSWTSCLVSNHPDICIVSPLGVSRCIWSAKLDGRTSTFLDSNPSTPQHEGAKDWISLATAMRDISDAHKAVPIFRRPSDDDATPGSVIMPRASSLAYRSSSVGSTNLKGILRTTSSSSQPNLVDGSSSTLFEGMKPRADSAPAILFRTGAHSEVKRVRFGPPPGGSSPWARIAHHLAPPSVSRGTTLTSLKAKLPPPSSSERTSDDSTAAPPPPTKLTVTRTGRARADASSTPLPPPDIMGACVAEEPVEQKQSRNVDLEKSLPSAPPQIPEFLFLFGDDFGLASDDAPPTPVKMEPTQPPSPKDASFIESWAMDVASGGSERTLAEERAALRRSLAVYQIVCPRPDPQVLRMQQQFDPLPAQGAETPGSISRRPPPLPPRTSVLPRFASDSSDSSTDDGIALAEELEDTIPDPRSSSSIAPTLPPFDFGVSRKGAVSYKEVPAATSRTMRLVPSNGPLIPPLDFDPYGCSVDFRAYISSKTELPPLPGN